MGGWLLTTDRIAEPWGTRTSYTAGESWSVRVDTHLEEGLETDAADRWVQAAAILHSKGDYAPPMTPGRLRI